MTVRKGNGECFSQISLHAFAFRMFLSASALALFACALFLPLLHFAGLVSASASDLAALSLVVTGLTGAISGWMALCTGGIIVQLTRSNASFERLSRLDELSGLLNRRAFAEALAKSAPGASLVMVDVDRFKAINDTHGHAVGDEVIRRVGQLIIETMGEGVPAARLGGEEFGLLLSDGDLEKRVAAVEALRARIENERFAGERGTFGITISAGLSETMPERDLSLAYAAADKALYLAKASGRNRVVHGAAGLNVILDMVAAGMNGHEDADLAGGRGAA
jgi:diguanylate cyclase (GGDEF)-like protein